MRAAFFVLLSLSSCAAIPMAPDVQASCLPLKAYTAAEQAQLSTELKKLSQDSAILGVMLDYEKMRDADRACISSTTKGAI